ncbi:MAG: DUF4147 domain-containing protein [Hyphomicrobiaceae bacterium]|nr:DUF4147 domain-containing protein [Hyphomicrobiaceae bacterium]
MREETARRLMMDCFKAAVRAAHPENCLEQFLPSPPDHGEIILLAGGKAAGSMMKVAVRHYLHVRLVDRTRICGVAVGKPDGFEAIYPLEWIHAGHPVPDEGSVRGAKRALQLAGQAGAQDLVVVLLSGGASALWCAPVEGLSLAEKQDVTKALLRSGARIDEINSVRRHLSKIKGGGLAQAAFPARLVTLAISDVVGNDPAVIGSGVTVEDASSLADARFVLEHYNIAVAPSVRAALENPANETLGCDDPLLSAATWRCITSNGNAFSGIGSRLALAGYDNRPNLGWGVEGEARDVARKDAELIRQYKKSGEKLALSSGGELTVKVTGRGRGGPNQEYALALALELDKSPGGLEGVYALCADTDGCDGGTGQPGDPAGAMIFPSTLQRAHAQKLNPATFLADNNSGAFFDALGDLLFTGSTGTNVNDFRLILLENA